MKRVVFLDRDGVINVDKNDYTWKIEDFYFTQNFFEYIKSLHEKEFTFIVITNQGGISKGLYSKEDVNILHAYMQKQFEANGLALLDIYYCPHHSVNEKCLCRKPGSLLFEKAIAKHNISSKHSYLIGDNERDIVAANNAGIKGIKITTNEGVKDAVNLILQQYAV